MRAVNLLPGDYSGHGGSRAARLPFSGVLTPVRAVPIAAALALIVALGAAYVTQTRSVSSKEETLAQLQAEIAARPKPEETAVPASDAAVRLAAATAASNARLPWEDILHQFALVLPEDVSITAMNATGTASGFSITGYTSSHPAVARLLERLDQAPALANVVLQSSTRTEADGGPRTDFSVVADVVSEGGTS
jgi:Tfp pilus assembly protein PilN